MTKEQHRLLYETDINNITAEDVEKLNLYLIRQNDEFMRKTLWGIGSIAGLGFPFLFSALANAWSVLDLLFGVSIISIGGFCGFVSLISYNAKLDISKKEWKEFKKSGGIKRIKNLVFEYTKTPKYEYEAKALEVEKKEKELAKATALKNELRQKVYGNARVEENVNIQLDNDNKQEEQLSINLDDINNC